MNDTTTFVGCEEESAVFNNRPAKSSTKLILLVIRATRIKIAPSIESLIPQELVNAAVPGVGAGLGDNVDYSARIASVSASNVLDNTRNSAMLSGADWMAGEFTKRSFPSPPFTLKLFDRPRPPLTETAPEVLLP